MGSGSAPAIKKVLRGSCGNGRWMLNVVKLPVFALKRSGERSLAAPGPSGGEFVARSGRVQSVGTLEKCAPPGSPAGTHQSPDSARSNPSSRAPSNAARRSSPFEGSRRGGDDRAVFQAFAKERSRHDFDLDQVPAAERHQTHAESFAIRRPRRSPDGLPPFRTVSPSMRLAQFTESSRRLHLKV